MPDPKELSKTIADTASIELQEKFNKGQKEHGGDFAEKPTVRNIREEVLDLINYTHSLVMHRRNILIELEKLINEAPSIEGHVMQIRLKNIKDLVHEL